MSGNATPHASPRSEPTHGSEPTPRFTSITGSIEEEPEQHAGGIPTQQQPQQQQQQDSRRDYGMLPIQSHATPTLTSLGSIRPTPVRHRSAAPSSLERREAGPGTPTSGMPPASPQPTRKPQKPPTLRRASTKRGVPHRGEQFSVDDDPNEVEEDRTPQTPRADSFPPLVRSNTMRRKTYTGQVHQLPRVDSQSEEEHEEEERERERAADTASDTAAEDVDDMGEDTVAEEEDEDDADALSDAESFTLRDRQLAINETHPFGIRIWKPALYKKNRSVEKNAEDDIHSSPSQIVSPWLWFFNCCWTLLFGWWLALASAIGAAVCFVFAFAPSAREYGRVFWGLAGYLFWPFGKFVKLDQDENYQEEDEGEGRSISEYERWQAGDLEYGRLMFGPTLTHTGSLVGRRRESIDSASERDSLLGRSGRNDRNDTGLTSRTKQRLFGRGQWTLGRIIFFVFFYFNVAPLLLLVSLVCWFLVYWIPMGRVTQILFYHLRKRPLALSFHKDAIQARSSSGPSTILLCTYRAVGTKYWKYTIDGTNIFLINFLGVVVFVILDFFFFRNQLRIDNFITSPALIFTLALISIIPLAYFIGQAVASISAQSTMGVGAAVNAFFSTIVEVYLYCIALNDGKGKLVEGSVIGSVFAGILLLPGLSMCFGAIKRKTQRFNTKSATASSTMLLFAVIAAFGPTLFYKIYGSHELICRTCVDSQEASRDCRQCYFRQIPAINDDFYRVAVRPYCWLAAVLLFATYLIGLLFTLRTHAAIIWSIDVDEKKAPGQAPTTEVSPMDTRRPSVLPSLGSHLGSRIGGGPNGTFVPRDKIRDSQLYKKILGPTLRQAGMPQDSDVLSEHSVQPMAGSGVLSVDHANKADLPHVVPPKSGHGDDNTKSANARPLVPGLSEEDNNNLVRQVAEMAATAASYAARDAVQHPREASYQATHSAPATQRRQERPVRASIQRISTFQEPASKPADAAHPEGGGHDAPNWSRTKSAVILLTATVAYAIVAEILVDTVDVVLTSVDIDEKFLGITLFALVPNTTEFLNGISFAMNGNIALSMEIGSAYALQVCMLQIPALVLFSAVHGRFIDPSDLIDHTFNLIFPQWDMVTVILCVFLLSYISGEGKSNYFKGSILVLTYVVVLMGFYYSGYTSLDSDAMGVDLMDTLALGSSMVWQQRGPAVPGNNLSRRSEL